MSLIYSRLSDGSVNREWMEVRRGKITASQIHRIMGTPAVRGTYLLELLVERLVGQIAGQAVTEDMQRGIDREAEAGRRYEEATGHALVDGYWIWDARGYGATPDFLVGGGGGVEAKCPQPKGMIAARYADALGAKWRDGQAYRWQSIACAVAAGEPWWDLAIYCPELDGLDLGLYVTRFLPLNSVVEEMLSAVEAANRLLTEQYDAAMYVKRRWVETDLIPAIERAQSHEAVDELVDRVYRLSDGALPPALVRAIGEVVRQKTLSLPHPMG